MTLALRVDNLSKAYGNLKAIDDISFDVERGEIFALLGPNGAGKTTCIEVLEGFLQRDGGAVEVLGVDPGERQHLRWLRDRIGVVLQELAVESFFTVRQVLERNAGFYPNPRPIDEVIELVGLSEKGNAKVKRLSGGQQRRLDIGLGIIGNPELLFLDEPTTGLDPAARRTTWDLIRLLSSEGTTVLMSSHYMDEVEALAHRVAVLTHGEIAALGPTESLGGRNEGEVTSAFQESGDIMLGLREGRFARSHVVAELGEVVSGGVPGRTSEPEITVFKSVGLAVEDLAAARLAYQRARERGKGIEIDLGG